MAEAYPSSLLMKRWDCIGLKPSVHLPSHACMLPFLDQCHFLEKKVGNHHHSLSPPKPHQYSNTLQETTICISWMLFCLLKPHSLLLRFGSFVIDINYWNDLFEPVIFFTNNHLVWGHFPKALHMLELQRIKLLNLTWQRFMWLCKLINKNVYWRILNLKSSKLQPFQKDIYSISSIEFLGVFIAVM